MFKKNLVAAAVVAPALIAAPFVQVDQADAKSIKKEQVEKNDHFNGQKLFGLAHKVVKKNEPVPVKFKGSVLGYLVVDIQNLDKGKLVYVKFVKELPSKSPEVEAPVEGEQPSEEPVVEAPVEGEQPSEEPVVEAPVEEEQPAEEVPVVDEQPTENPETPVEEEHPAEEETPLEIPVGDAFGNGDEVELENEEIFDFFG